MKKIVILFIALIIFIFPINHSMFPNEASAIWGKVANESAKKVAKEVIKEIAQETAINMAVNEAQKIADAASWNLNVKDEYTAICMEALQPSGECKKPAQIKTTLTETDKSNISATAGTELEKALNNGVKYTKWQKFLDFFLPIFSVSLVLTGISYAIDPEVKSLFDDVAINTLIALGLMQPIYANVTPSPTVTDATTGEPLPEKPMQPPGTTPSLLYKNEFIDKQYANIILTPTLFTTSSAVIFQDLAYNNTTLNSATLTVKREVNSGTIVFWNFPSNGGNPSFSFHGQMNNITVKQGSTVLATATTGTSINVSASLFTDLDKLKSIMTRLPYYSNGYWYTTLLFNTVSGLTYTVTGSSVNAPPGTQVKQLDANVWAKTNTGQIAQQLTVYENATFKEWEPYQPNFEEMTVPTSPTKYEDEDEVILIPPIAIPYTHTDTGEQLELKHDPTTGTTEVVDKDGNIVPEEKVKVGDPVVTTDPEGKPQVQPPPTTSNPSPEPIPLTPTTPTTPTTPIETESPVFPEGESCEQGLKFPKFKQLGETVSHGFPFSLPFDIYRGWTNVFSGIGTEKPEFEYKLNFMGEQQIWEIGIPDYFDSWKKFTDILLVVIFDISLLYLFNRFFGAHGSD